MEFSNFSSLIEVFLGLNFVFVLGIKDVNHLYWTIFQFESIKDLRQRYLKGQEALIGNWPLGDLEDEIDTAWLKFRL